jgi:hypothetical protein
VLSFAASCTLLALEVDPTTLSSILLLQDLMWVLQDLGPLIFDNRWVLQALAWLLQGLAWVLQDLVLNKYGCTRLPADCLGGYCFGSVGLDVFGL